MSAMLKDADSFLSFLLSSGHSVMIREKKTIGDNVSVVSSVIIDRQLPDLK